MVSVRARRSRRVLVVYKRTALQSYRQRSGWRRIESLMESQDPAVHRVQEAHDSHFETIERTKVALKRLGVRAAFRHRIHKIEDADLVVTLGGDGTLLWASHHVRPKLPMIAINSAPGSSIGFFCAGTRENVEETLERALRGDLKAVRLNRMQVEVDDHVISTRVLNDILFCHASPAVTVRYLIEHRGVVEEHRSSGVWVGPAAGSTAAQRSAGGRVLPIASRKLQFVVREPYRALGTSYRLDKGIVTLGESVVLHSKMRDGRVFLDGAHRVHEVHLGQRIRLTSSTEPLTVLGLRRS